MQEEYNTNIKQVIYTIQHDVPKCFIPEQRIDVNNTTLKYMWMQRSWKDAPKEPLRQYSRAVWIFF